MKTYLVGGAVRDKLLGLDGADEDFVVLNSTHDEMLAQGFKQIGKDFPVFLHPKTKQEYALARLERKIGAGYKGFEVDTKGVSLKEDLSRRDLTINAMAIDVEDKTQTLIDPFGGQEDLAQGLLKHISPAFAEDPVRILRVARFGARFKDFGFKVAHSTYKLMQSMVVLGEVDALVSERVWAELSKALSYQTPSVFFTILHSCGALAVVMPELCKLASGQTDTQQDHFLLLDQLNTQDIAIKWAVLCADLSACEVETLGKRLNIPKAVQQLAVLSAKYNQFVSNIIKYSNSEVLAFYLGCDAIRRAERFETLLTVFELLTIQTDLIRQLWQQIQAIDISQLDKKNIVVELSNKRLEVIEVSLNAYFVNNTHNKGHCET